MAVTSPPERRAAEGQHGPAYVGLDGRPRVAPREPVFRWTPRWLALVVVVVLAALAAGAAVSALHHSAYKARIRMLVGSEDPVSQAVGGFSGAQVTLASTYARVVDSTSFDALAARRLGLRPAVVAARTMATPEPQQPFVRIETSAPTQAEAMHMATVSRDVLIGLVAEVVGTNPPGAILAHYAEEARVAAVARQSVAVDWQLYGALQGAADEQTLAATRGQIGADQSRVDVAEARLRQLTNHYETAMSIGSDAALISMAGPPKALGTDRSTYRLFAFTTALCTAAVLLALVGAAAKHRPRRPVPEPAL